MVYLQEICVMSIGINVKGSYDDDHDNNRDHVVDEVPRECREPIVECMYS